MIWYKALTIALGGVCAFFYASRVVKTQYGAFLCGLLYSLSTFQIVNLFFHFSDSLVFFPLLLLGLDLAMENKGGLLFSLSVALAACTNAVFFFSEAVFLILYFAVKLWCREYTLSVRKFFEMAGYTVSGLMAAGVILLPTVISVAGNPRASAGFESAWQLLFLKPVHFAEIFRSLLFPAEFMSTRALYILSNTVQADLYIPLFGCVLWAAYVLRNRKSFTARLLTVCLVFALVPFLNSAFMLFNAEYYARWLFMPAFFMAIATVNAYEDRTLSLKKGFSFVGGLALIFVGNIIWWRIRYGVGSVIDPIKFCYLIVVAAGGLIFCLLLRSIQRLQFGNVMVASALCIFVLGTGFINTLLVKEAYTSQGFSAEAFFNAEPELSKGEYYRIDTVNSYINKGYLMDVSSVNSFSSTIAPSVFDFYRLLGCERTVRSNRSNDIDSIRTLLSCRYIVASPGYDFKLDKQNKTAIAQSEHYTVYETDYYIPMGYAYRYAVTQEEFDKLPAQLKDEALVAALVLDEQTEAYGLQWLSAEKLSAAALWQLEDEVAFHQDHCCSSFTRTRTGYEAEITLRDGAMVFFSIPYSKGFTVTVNGVVVQPIVADYAFYAVPCDAGNNKISFVYRQPGLRAGCLLSAAGICVIIAMTILQAKRNKEHNEYGA